MFAQSYKIVFNGEITTGYEIGDVKVKLAELFKLNNSRADVLFNGKRVVVKKDLDEQTAIKYQKFLEQAGAICKIEGARDQVAGNQISEEAAASLPKPGHASFRCDNCGLEKKIPAKCTGHVIRCPKCKDEVWVDAAVVVVPKKKNIGEQIVESINKPANDRLNNQISINGLNAKLAGREKRLANFFIDILLACYVFPFAVGFALGVLGLGSMLDIIPDLLLGLTIILSYYVIFEQCLGKTPAKFITRTKVFTVDGKKPTFTNIVVRNICRFIPFEAFSFLGENGWHDQFSKTIVVEAK
jgi:uncharacterized RDD family membrane protein YckC